MTNVNQHPEDLSPDELRERQLQRLSVMLEEISSKNGFWRKKYADAGIVPEDIRSLDDLGKLPFCTKAELVDDQLSHPPYGTNLTYPLADYSRLHQTSGTTGQPMRWLDTPASWNWFMECWAQIFRMVGLRSDDRLCFPFSFGPFIGFWAAFEGANRLGNLCLAGGGMTSIARLRLIEENRATVICCTPTYALRLAEVAKEEGIDLAEGSVRALVVAGEPGGSIPAICQRIEEAWGARMFDHWGMTEIGALAVECAESPGGMHVLETECIAEIVNPETGQPVEAGTEGELIITNLGRAGSPLIRYRTGDLVRAETNSCPCGRHLLRLDGGILGRVDDMVTIRGNNVFPTSIEAILREIPDVVEFRIEVRTVRSMQQLKIQIEPAPSCVGEAITQLVKLIDEHIKDRLNFHAEVEAVECGSLPRFELKGRRFFKVDD